MDHRPFLVLFPGAWGNRTPDLAKWWLRHVIAHFKHDYQIVVLTYKGKSLDDYVRAALIQLEEIPDGSLALCYSMGAQVARGVAAKRPALFKRVALFSGLERIGVRVRVFLTALTFMLVPMLRTLIGRPLKLDTTEQVTRVFFHPLSRRLLIAEALNRATKASFLTARDLLDHHLVPEPSWAMLRLFLPGLRQRFSPLPCPVLAIVPQYDFVLPSAKYPGENVQRVTANGDHSLIIRNGPSAIYLNRIASWFTL